MATDTILLVDDDPAAIQLMARMLGGVAALRFAVNGADALRLVRAAPPDLILLDAEMPGMSGFDLCRALKADPALVDVPVVFVTSHTDPSFEVAGFEVGAADFIVKPVSAPLMMVRVQTQLRIKRMADELRRLSVTDGLTGIANRRCFDQTLEHEWVRARRSGDPISLLLVDVDHFKLFNDRYGHPAGDACLKSVAQAMIGTTHRPADQVARYGGEEFSLLLPHTPRGGAETMAQRVLDAVAALRIDHAGSPSATFVNVSVGVSSYDAASACWIEPSASSRFIEDQAARTTAGTLLQAADQALYVAKQSGRGCARLLDVADVAQPALARPIEPRPGQGAAAAPQR